MGIVFLDYYSREYHPAFRKDLKKLDKPVIKEIQRQLDIIVSLPMAGEELVGNLAGIYSHHFKYSSVEYRIAYMVENDKLIIYFISATSRENFYKNLSRRVE
jgi:addiction module RelE/StbE family toxin